MRRFTFLLLLAVVLAGGCKTGGASSAELSSAELCARAENWYDTGKEVREELVDVFYILETCTFDWTDADGNIHRHANLDCPEDRENMRVNFDRACAIFGDSTNFFAPYYRHVTLDVWMDGLDSVAAYTALAYNDVKAAFDYYMEHLNGGRKFALAGFSQGGMLAKELIKNMSDSQYENFLAAYIVGYPVYAEEVEHCRRFVPARGAEDTGVVISFNSAANENGIGELFKGTSMIINPVNWTTDSTPAAVNDTVTCAVSQEHLTLFVDGIDPETIYIPSFSACFPYGNYHLLEMVIYADHLRKNIKQRLY